MVRIVLIVKTYNAFLPNYHGRDSVICIRRTKYCLTSTHSTIWVHNAHKEDSQSLEGLSRSNTSTTMLTFILNCVSL